MMIRARTATLALTFLLVCASITYADFAFEVRQNGVAGNSFDVSAGGMIDLDLYIKQTGNNTGLVDFGIGAFVIGFDDSNMSANNASFIEYAFAVGTIDSFFGGTFLEGFYLDSVPKGNPLKIATLKVRGGSEGNVTQFSIVDPDQGFDDVVLNNASAPGGPTVLDSFVFSSPLQFTINTGPTAVPEPTSLAMVVVAGGGALIAKARRKKKLSKV